MLYAHGASAKAAVPSEQLLLFTYSTALWHQDPGDPASPAITLGDLLARAVANAADLDGLPDSFRAATASQGKARGKEGAWLVANTRSSVEPFLTYSTRRGP